MYLDSVIKCFLSVPLVRPFSALLSHFFLLISLSSFSARGGGNDVRDVSYRRAWSRLLQGVRRASIASESFNFFRY